MTIWYKSQNQLDTSLLPEFDWAVAELQNGEIQVSWTQALSSFIFSSMEACPGHHQGNNY